MISQEAKQIIQQTLAPFEPKRIGIFGSVVRGEDTSESDLDILVEFKKSIR
ncbi:MAG: nucleotidyltransferase domain-containing protein, partial [Flavisolibacter sp.]|nr:nucleotidyltransferase domain-containing protein [Flavisolibacter sp.]